MEHKRPFVTEHRYVPPGSVDERLLRIVDDYEKTGIDIDDLYLIFCRDLKFRELPESYFKTRLSLLAFNKRVRYDLRRGLYYPGKRVL